MQVTLYNIKVFINHYIIPFKSIPIVSHIYITCEVFSEVKLYNQLQTRSEAFKVVNQQQQLVLRLEYTT